MPRPETPARGDVKISVVDTTSPLAGEARGAEATHHPSQRTADPDLVAYMADMIDELRDLAEGAGLKRLGTILDLARDEARWSRVARR